ncbi:hypothetical protein HU200_061094 [Digitaria exilis]|uniref:Uncharacterized protein n=1 Tax=Digitaria exilis TaxID=1010633 RepID=A0A835AFH7_9POAL|nr:hypothetical protein HU200_061094 [Digitaria exilis]
MASHLLLHPLAAIVALLCSVATGQDYKVIPSCSTTDNYTDVSQYKKNLDELLGTLSTAALDNGWYYKGSAGAGGGADEVFGLIMCFADRNATQCRECLSQAPARVAAACPGSRSASAAYDACVLRYSAAPIPATADLAVELAEYVSGEPVTSQGLANAWLTLMTNLTSGVHDDPLRIANGSTPYSSSQEMYGLAQCTRDLNGTECSYCINSCIGQLSRLFPNNTGGAVKGYSCYLIYQVGALEITLPPAVVSPPPAAAALPPSSLQPSPAASFVVFLAFLTWLHRLLRRKQARILNEATEQELELEEGGFFDDEPAMEDEFEKGTGPKRFRYGELAIATDNFSDTHKLGEGGFGSVYIGFLKEMNTHVAIKRVSKGSKQGRKEYASEVRIISRLRHRNLVQLIGWCHDAGELLLVASAILYLHQDWEQCVLHRDIKPSNVMLDASFNAKLGDFGLARLVDHGRGSHTTVLAGTMGYMDPECMITGRASAESDVYSFGVVLLEIACGRRPLVSRHGDEEEDGGGEENMTHIVQWAWEFYGRGDILDAGDERLNGEFDAGDMETVMVVGLCLRPSIRQAVNVLRGETPLPSLPARTPVATYMPPPEAFYYTSSVATGSSTGTGTGTGTTTHVPYTGGSPGAALYEMVHLLRDRFPNNTSDS